MPSGHGQLDIRGAVLIDGPLKPATITNVRVTRSFSYKKNLGNYQMADFFASQSADCAPEDAAEVSSDLDQFCMDEVRESVRSFERQLEKKEAAKAHRSAA